MLDVGDVSLLCHPKGFHVAETQPRLAQGHGSAHILCPQVARWSRSRSRLFVEPDTRRVDRMWATISFGFVWLWPLSPNGPGQDQGQGYSTDQAAEQEEENSLSHDHASLHAFFARLL